jgi:hypothetical protein
MPTPAAIPMRIAMYPVIKPVSQATTTQTMLAANAKTALKGE